MKNLSLLIFTTGAVTLGMELSASRLLEPVFGNNQIVWASLIGLILLYLSVGAWLGGRLADRYPRRREFDMAMTIAAAGVGLVPALSRPVLKLAAGGMAGFAPGLLAGSMLAMLLLFSVPGVLLGTATPWAVRLSLTDLGQSGHTTGRLYALATAGSLVGTFLPVLWLIPAVGTRWTFFLLSLTLLAVVVLGSITYAYRWIPIVAFIAVLVLAFVSDPGGPIRQSWDQTSGPIIYEDESAYNYIVVRQWGPERHLKLNDGIGIHSVYHPQMLLSQGIWDYFLLAPFLADPPALPTEEDRLLIIGLAAGTVSSLFTDIFGPIDITGIELDPQIISVGRQYFDMNERNLTAIAADGRHWLSRQPASARWDLIAVDAYRPPYIPFHLTTVEFFTLARRHLTPDGVLAINVGRTPTNFALVDALASTLGAIFPSVYVFDEPGPPNTLANSLIVATARPTSIDNFAANLSLLDASFPAEFDTFAGSGLDHLRVSAPPPDAPIFTDNRAPVERIVHGIILDFLRMN